MILDLNDRQSQCWAKLRKHLEERIQDHRIKNDGNMSAEDTAKMRGRIAEINYIFGLEIEGR